MAAPDLSGLIHVGYAILATTVNAVTNKILAQLGDVRGASDTDNAEWMQHVGFASRPSAAVKGKAAAQAVVVRGGDRDACIASQDARGVDLYGRMKEGETTVYAAGVDGKSQGRTLYKDDGSVNNFTTEGNDATPGAKSIYSRIATGIDKNGMPDGFTWVAPWGTIKFDVSGFHISHISGASFDLGGMSGPVIDELGLGSYVAMQAATVSIQASGITQGTGAADALAKTLPTLEMFAALQAEITVLQASVATLQAHNAAIGLLPIVIGPVAASLPTFGFAVTAVGLNVGAAVDAGIALGKATTDMPSASSAT